MEIEAKSRSAAHGELINRFPGLEKKLRNADSATTAFKVCLEGFITAYDRCIEYIEKIIDADDKERCEMALSRAVERMAHGG